MYCSQDAGVTWHVSPSMAWEVFDVSASGAIVLTRFYISLDFGATARSYRAISADPSNPTKNLLAEKCRVTDSAKIVCVATTINYGGDRDAYSRKYHHLAGQSCTAMMI